MFELIALRHDGNTATELHGIPIDGIRRALRDWRDTGARDPLCVARHINRAHLQRLSDVLSINGIKAEVRELPKLEPVPPPLTRAPPPPTATQSTPRGNVHSESGLYALRSGSADEMPFSRSASGASPVVVRTGVRTGKHGALRGPQTHAAASQTHAAASQTHAAASQTHAAASQTHAAASPTRPVRVAEPARRPAPAPQPTSPRTQPLRPPAATSSSPIPSPYVARSNGSDERVAHLDEVPPTTRMPVVASHDDDREPSASSSNITNYRNLIAEQDLRGSSAVHAMVRGVSWIRASYITIAIAAVFAYFAYRRFYP